ncbi:sialidase family protein [Flavobacterium sp. HJJ]|uniref:sialidase family protein n=1 Tax=Flavobacterium sp. HJJ TaxID=2783792 RepID=UPI00188D6E92|nr:sialidase family protein [Flavobacterium sp. HJJ]MBF4470427.1 exo-alpha-sialidase [Flavobacterium sp. HJJ]
MRNLLITFLMLLLVVFFTHCSSEKEPVSITTLPDNLDHKPQNYLGKDFVLFDNNPVIDSDLYLEGGILQNQSDTPRFLKSTRIWQGTPSIGSDYYGNLYVAWVTGGPGEGNENYLTVSLSKDKGKSWSHDKLITYVDSKDSTRLMDVGLFNDKFGNLYMNWAKHVKKKNFIKKVWAVSWYSKLNLSKEGDTIRYTPPRKIAEGSMINKPFYSEFSDQIVFPISRWYEGNSDLHQPFIYKANYGTSHLNNFTKVGSIPLDPSIMSIHEHMVLQLKDSTYFGMVRTLDGIYYSKSQDGNNWDMGKKFTQLGPTTPARFHLAKLKSGRLILIFNNSQARSNMMIYLSDDDGVTWPYKMVIDAGNYVSYPDMIETEKGVLNIVYDYARKPYGTIYFVSVKEDDIIKNVSTNIYRTKISTLQ